MARTRIDIPATFTFTCNIPIRITDVNYGGHVGNDSVLTIIHEARMQFLAKFGYTEMDIDGCGLIMADVAIEFKHELFYGDELTASVSAGNFSRIGLDMYYKLEKKSGDKIILAAVVKTGMICYDYKKKKIVSMPAAVKEKLGD